MKRVKILQPLVELPKVPGMGRDGDYLTFRGIGETRISEILKKISESGERPQFVALEKQYSPTESDWTRIKTLVKPGVDVANFGVYRTVASSTRIDSDRDKFGKAVIDKLAEHYQEGRTVVIEDHSGRMGIGKTFEAAVEMAPDGQHDLVVKFYVDDQLNGSSGNAKRLLDSGVYDRVSIKAFIGYPEYIESTSSADGRGYWLYDQAERVQTAHLAVVDYGANPDAKFKSAGGKSEKTESANFGEIETIQKQVRMKYQIKSLNQEVELGEDIKPVIEQLDGKVISLTESLKKYQDAEAVKLKALQDDYQNKLGTLHPSATEAEKAIWKQKASVFPAELLEVEISTLDVQLKKLKTEKQFDTHETGKKSEKPKSYMNNY